MAFLLVVTFLLIAGVIGLNLFIALLSDTFQRVYDNAQANALLQKVNQSTINKPLLQDDLSVCVGSTYPVL